MSTIRHIPVSVEVMPTPDTAPNGHAVLVEVEALLSQLIETGETGSIDLRAMPMGPADISYLRASLGEGEVSISIDALGPSEIQETGIQGVWWTNHRSSDGTLMAEIIEVTRCPEIISAQPADIQASLAILRSKIVQQ